MIGFGRKNMMARSKVSNVMKMNPKTGTGAKKGQRPKARTRR